MSLAVKILGFIDLVAAFVFLMQVFGIDPFTQLVLYSAGLLLVKGLFIFSGDILSGIDLISAMLLLISLIFSLPIIFLWLPAFLLLAKGFVSFI